MVAIDTNVLVYAEITASRHHARALEVLTELDEGSLPWAIPWPCVYERHAAVMHRVVRSTRVSGNLFHDAHIVALCLEHGVTELLSGDADFARFAELSWRDPFRT